MASPYLACTDSVYLLVINDCTQHTTVKLQQPAYFDQLAMSSFTLYTQKKDDKGAFSLTFLNKPKLLGENKSFNP